MMQSFTFYTVLQGRAQHILKTLGLADPTRLNAKAFYRLQANLFRLDGVRAVAVHGFAHSAAAGGSDVNVSVEVITADSPTGLLLHEIERVFSEINRRYDTTMKAVVLFGKSSDSGLDSRPASGSATQVLKKVTAITTSAKNHR